MDIAITIAELISNCAGALSAIIGVVLLLENKKTTFQLFFSFRHLKSTYKSLFPITL